MQDREVKPIKINNNKIITVSRQYGSGGREIWEQQVYSFYVCAGDEFRAQRGQEYYQGMTLPQLKKEDKKRASYYNYYTGNTWGAPLNYDLVLNTGRMSLDKAADLILERITAD